MSNRFFVRGKMDYVFLASIIALLIIGVVMVYSSSYFVVGYENNDPNYLIRKEIIFAVAGLLLMIGASKMNYKKLRDWAVAINALTVFSYLLLLTPLGIDFRGGLRWVGIGGMTFMPSDLAKYAGVIALAYLLTAKKNEKGSAGYWFLVVCPIFYLAATLLQPDLSTSIVIAGAMFATLFFAGLRLTYIFTIFALGAVGLFFSIILKPFRLARMKVFIDPFIDPQGKGFQPIQSLYAVASGRINGVGLGNGIQKMLYLPLSYNDYIFSIYAEELGFIGCVILIVILCVLVFRGFKIATNSPDKFSTLLVGGIVSQIAIQSVMHMYVSTSLFPSTGIPFPIISYGGTSLLTTLGALGIILGISRLENRKIPKAFDNVENKSYHSLERRNSK